MSRIAALLVLLPLAAQARAQHPLRHPADGVEIRYARSQPVVFYTLRVDPADLSGFAVEIRIRNAPDTFRLALAAHPEYDDRYWRYVEGLRVEARGGAGAVAREDSALWRVTAPGGEAIIRYSIRLPPPVPQPQPRAAWRPFLAPTGGLVGGPHGFMYLAGGGPGKPGPYSYPSHVRLELPAGWEIATGLEPTADPATFFAPSVDVLVDSPLLVGRLRSWRFAVDGVPHRVVYWPLPEAVVFDTAALVGSVQQVVNEAIRLFGRAPYREYTFLFQDGAYGALEHLNSVTIGAPSADLARGLGDVLGETAHEYFHTWNLMRIRPIEYRGVDYRPPEPSRGLWWSEGITMYYADLLQRRAGLRLRDSTRTAHLEAAIGRYLSRPGNGRLSPERVSLGTYGSAPGSLGDYDASVHLQGELLATMLDLMIRNATAGRRSLDELMRVMLERFSGERGFDGPDIERTVAETCGCSVGTFFQRYVRGGNPIDFDRYLELAGLRTRVSWTPALGRDGQPLPDLRLFAWTPPGEGPLGLLLSDPATAWGRAGLHTGDRLASLNGAAISSVSDFRLALGRLHLGDTVRVEVRRAAGPWRTAVVLTGYDRPVVRVEEIPVATERQRTVRARWLAGQP